jgi:hypothetical protein
MWPEQGRRIMNVFQAEVLNTLTTHRYDWSPAEILIEINQKRTDHPDKPTIRKVQRALLALHELDKVVRVRLSMYEPYRYRMANPKRLTFSEAMHDLKEVIPLWPGALFGVSFIVVGLGSLYFLKGILDMLIWIVKWVI